MAAALTPPADSIPALVAFAPDSHWRGETHRMMDRPGSVHRLLEEVAAAGVTQVIVVSAVRAGRRTRTCCGRRGLDPRQRLGDYITAVESAALRDALEMARLRFDAVFTIRPSHNALGPFDVAGAFDEASERRQDLAELIDCGYEDACRQFIEPVVGASGDQLAQAQSRRARRHGPPASADRLFGA